ncbi:hypothetical protein ACFXD5_41200 [Streptomyces sp. NPDC059385]
MTTSWTPQRPGAAPLVAAALGMDAEGVMIYLADHVDEQRLPLPLPQNK